jgi:hypothetical protein
MASAGNHRKFFIRPFSWIETDSQILRIPKKNDYETRHKRPGARNTSAPPVHSTLRVDSSAAASCGREALGQKHPAVELLFAGQLRQSHGRNGLGLHHLT